MVCVDEFECDNDSSIEAAGREIVRADTILDCSVEVTPTCRYLRGRNLIADREPDISLLINLCAMYDGLRRVGILVDLKFYLDHCVIFYFDCQLGSFYDLVLNR